MKAQVKWEDLYFYKRTVVLDQLTFVFCQRFLPKYGDRTVDQMIQAARSGKQNIVEGFADGVTSTEMELVRQVEVNIDYILMLIAEGKLKSDETVAFFEGSLRDDFLKTTGTDIDLILPPMSRFGGGNREEKKQSIIAKIKTLFERYKGLAG